MVRLVLVSASSQSRTFSISFTLSLLSTLALCLSLSFTLAFTEIAFCNTYFLAKCSFFIWFSFEKRVKVALLSDCSCKRMFFFCLLNDLRVKFWFLCDFWWKMKSFWSFYCSVLDLKRFLHLGFDFCWFWSKVCSFMSFTWSFLVLGGQKKVFCKCFKWFFMKNDVFVCLSFDFHVKFVFLYAFW